MSPKIRILQVILRLAGTMMLLAAPAAFMPNDAMNAVHEWIGLGAMPQGPIVDYLARSLSLFYALHGAILLFIARDPRRHLSFFRFYLYVSYPFAIALFFVDLHAGLPLSWTLSEAPIVLGLLTLLLVLLRGAEASERGSLTS